MLGVVKIPVSHQTFEKKMISREKITLFLNNWDLEKKLHREKYYSKNFISRVVDTKKCSNEKIDFIKKNAVYREKHCRMLSFEAHCDIGCSLLSN